MRKRKNREAYIYIPDMLPFPKPPCDFERLHFGLFPCFRQFGHLHSYFLAEAGRHQQIIQIWNNECIVVCVIHGHLHLFAPNKERCYKGNQAANVRNSYASYQTHPVYHCLFHSLQACYL